jgi:hypothetical protein
MSPTLARKPLGHPADDPRALRRAVDAALAGDRTEIENRVALVIRVLAALARRKRH